MTKNIHKILQELTKALTVEVTKEVTTQLRKSYVNDITAILKDYLNKNEVLGGSNSGWLTLEDIATKYHISVRAVSYKCKQFDIERKQIGRHNLVNETQFLKAHDRPMEKPQFLKQKSLQSSCQDG